MSYWPWIHHWLAAMNVDGKKHDKESASSRDPSSAEDKHVEVSTKTGLPQVRWMVYDGKIPSING